MNNKLFNALVEIFTAGDNNSYVELDGAKLSRALEPFGYNDDKRYCIDLDKLFQSNGFSRTDIFSQIYVLVESVFKCVITVEYSDNTGESYYRFFKTVEDYNKHVCVDLTRVR